MNHPPMKHPSKYKTSYNFCDRTFKVSSASKVDLVDAGKINLIGCAIVELINIGIVDLIGAAVVYVI